MDNFKEEGFDALKEWVKGTWEVYGRQLEESGKTLTIEVTLVSRT